MKRKENNHIRFINGIMNSILFFFSHMLRTSAEMKIGRIRGSIAKVRKALPKRIGGGQIE